MPAASEQLSALEILVGSWDTTIIPYTPDGSDGPASSGTDIYEWSPNGQFLYHYVDATVDGTRIQSLEIMAADGKTPGLYLTHSYDPDGTINAFTAHLEDRTWLLTGETQRFTGQFSPDGQELSGQWEQREAAQWAPLMKVHLRKRLS